MRILNIITIGLKREGITNAFLGFYRLMGKTDFRIDLISSGKHWQDVIDEFHCYGCSVIKFPNRKKETLKYIYQLWHILKSNQYDIVHVNGSSTLMTIELFLAKLAGVKVRIAHSHNTTCSEKVLNTLLRPIFNNCYNVAFACGEDAGRWLFRNKSFTVIHNGKDFDSFGYSPIRREEIRKRYGISKERVVGFVGNLNEQKNTEYLLEIYREIHRIDNKARFFVIGDGIKYEEMKCKTKEYGIQSHTVFTGRISNVNEMLHAMDIMLLPSRWEGLPTVVIEWQAAGLPCIISDRITKECAVTDLVHFRSIEEPAEEWAKGALAIPILGRETKSSDCCRQLVAAGFDLKRNVKKLHDLYFNLAH